jgi:hypothetical protein
MADTGFKAGLEAAVEEARSQELSRLVEQPDLFADPGSAASGSALAPVGVVVRGPGRPLGARNKRTDAAAQIYKSRFGDPLSRGVEISALPILANGGRVLVELSKVLGMNRGDAARWWAGIYAATMPYIHTRLATLTVKPEGSPGGEPVALAWSYTEDEVLDHLELTHDQPQHGDEA